MGQAETQLNCEARRKKSSVRSCGAGALTAHETSRLMLLGSPPDMVRGHPLRETGSAAACGGLLLLFYYIISQMATGNFTGKETLSKNYSLKCPDPYGMMDLRGRVRQITCVKKGELMKHCSLWFESVG